MKYREALIEQLSALPHFTKSDIISLSRHYGIKKPTIDTYINRSIARKDLISLKKGMYVTTYFYEKHRAETAYPFYLANVLRTPSYVTSWAALQYYNLTTEAILTITSATLKVTRSFRTKVGNFIYQSIHQDLFFGYTLIKGDFSFYIASPSKALFDLLYFKTRQFRGIHFNAIPLMVEDLRIDIHEMNKKERNLFYKRIKEYLGHDQ